MEGQICPGCGIGKIVRRTNKTNKTTFYGCSNYPYCKFSCTGFPKVQVGCPRCAFVKENPDRYYTSIDGYSVYPPFRSRAEWDNWDVRYARKIPFGILVMQKTKSGKTYYACSSQTASPYHVTTDCRYKASYTQVDQETGDVYMRGHRAPQFRGNYMQERREEMVAQGYTHEEIENECGEDVFEEVYGDMMWGDYD